MPRIGPEKCYQGGHVDRSVPADLDRDWSKPPWANAAELQARVLPRPDQSKYGTTSSDPLGRNAPEWTKGRNGLPVKVKGDSK